MNVIATNVFTDLGIPFVHHYGPLHYLPYIARSRSLKSKPALRNEGFSERHFRSKSWKQDEARGFGEYVFLTLTSDPRIVKAKLKGGFPHIAFIIPTAAFDDIEFDLCRYNVAMVRYLRRKGSTSLEESATNGRYYGEMQIPIARQPADQQCLLEKHVPKGTMIEVLVRNEFELPDDTEVICYHDDDKILADEILASVRFPWGITVQDTPGEYKRDERYAAAVSEFIRCSIADPNWTGNGLEFDRV